MIPGGTTFFSLSCQSSLYGNSPDYLSLDDLHQSLDLGEHWAPIELDIAQILLNSQHTQQLSPHYHLSNTNHYILDCHCAGRPFRRITISTACAKSVQKSLSNHFLVITSQPQTAVVLIIALLETEESRSCRVVQLTSNVVE